MVSRLRSPRRSAPHTLHRFRLSRRDAPKLPRTRPRHGTSRLFRADLGSVGSLLRSAASAAALSWAMRSASSASASASGESGIVSREEMLGLRERADVGVLGIDERYKPPELP